MSGELNDLERATIRRSQALADRLAANTAEGNAHVAVASAMIGAAIQSVVALTSPQTARQLFDALIVARNALANRDGETVTVSLSSMLTQFDEVGLRVLGTHFTPEEINEIVSALALPIFVSRIDAAGLDDVWQMMRWPV